MIDMTAKLVKHQPTIKDMFQIPIVGGGRINPEGDKVIYGLAYVDNFQDNQVEVHSFLYDSQVDKSYQFTTTGTVSGVRWVDNRTLALLKTTPKSGPQIHIFQGLVGEGQQITDHPGGIETFETFGNGFIFIAESSADPRASRESKYGSFINVEEEESRSALYYLDCQRLREYRRKSLFSGGDSIGLIKPVIELSKLLDRPYKIESVIPSPTGEAVFINCRSKEDSFYNDDTYCFRIEFDPDSIFDDEKRIDAFGKLTRIALPRGARIRAVSPNGNKLLIFYTAGDPAEHNQSDLWVLDISLAKETLESPELEKHLLCITQNFDQEPMSVYWTRLGIFCSYWNESTCEIAHLDESGEVEAWDLQGLLLEYFFLNNDAHIFLRAASPTKLAEIYVGSPKSKGWDLKSITQFTERFAGWDFGIAESIKWTSKDGVEIEGILRKPSNFDPSKKYPLVFNIHGGPRAVSPFILLENNNRYFYPTVQLLNKDILILEPNYRGSFGKGQSFLKLNIDNLGTGDMWDLESAIDHLVAQGFVDKTRVGSMGWSQGGYISTFAAMHTTMLKAASAGAALSDWRIYFGGSDERQSILLSGDPHTNTKAFDKAAPIRAINKAKTPILFQHGEKDPRVPLISAMEMFRAMKARGVETHLIVFPGQGHGFLKPRESYAVMTQNYRWFVHHLLGEDLDLLLDDTADPPL